MCNGKTNTKYDHASYVKVPGRPTFPYSSIRSRCAVRAAPHD